MSGAAPARQRRMFNVSQETFESIFSFVYTALMVNVALIVFNLPLVTMLFLVPDPLASWPFFLLLSLTFAPSLAGAFATFLTMRDDGPARPLQAFWRGYRRNAARAGVVGVASGLIVAIAMLDLTALAGTPAAMLVGPLLVVLACTAVAIAIFAVAGFALYETVRAWPIVKASVYLAAKRWYFSIMALALVAIMIAAALLQPVLGIVLVPSVTLFAVWGNAHFSFTRLTSS